MTWTTTPPTEPGYYWYRESPAHRAQIVLGHLVGRVLYFDMRPGGSDDFAGDDMKRLCPTSEWAGALEPPP